MDVAEYSLSLGEWLYVFAAALSTAAMLWGAVLVAWFSRRRALPESLAGAAVVVFGAAALSYWLTEWRGSTYGFGSLNIRDLFAKVLLALALSGALLSGAVVVGVAVGAPLRGFSAGRARALLIAGGPLVLLAAAVPALAWAIRDSAPSGHPNNTDVAGALPADIVAQGLEFPTGLAIGPDGEVFFSELGGRIGVVGPASEPGPLPVHTVAHLPVPPDGALFHIALHPEWPSSPYLYASVQQVFEGELGLGIVRLLIVEGRAAQIDTLIERLPTGGHVGAAIAFCEGAFYVTVGDTSARDRALVQVPLSAVGKVLRYRLEGTDLVPAGTVHDDPPVFAMGFRNPFAATCDPGTALPLVADNGPETNDQIRLVRSGSNHEWPFRASRSLFTPALYDTEGLTVAPTGIVSRPLNDGSREVFFTGFKTNSVYRFVVAKESEAASPLQLAYQGDEPLLAMALGPDGCIYFATTTAIWRLREPAC